MNKVTKMMAGVVAIGAVAVPAAFAVPAFASDAPTTTAPTTTAPATAPTGTAPKAAAGQQNPTRGQRLLRRALLNKVSAQLGITPDALKAAVKDARTNHKPAQPITDPTARRQYWLGQVASELHVTPEKLQAAVKTARQEIRAELLGN